MDGKAGIMSAIADLFHHADRRNCASGHVVRVLDLDQARLRASIARRRNLLLDCCPGKNAVIGA